MRLLRDEGEAILPKEKIYDGCELFDIEVGWGLGHDVQLGITTHDGRSLVDWLAGQDRTPQDPDAPEGSLLPGFSSLWASLDRSGVNRLIKALRKARDDAFGRDE